MKAESESLALCRTSQWQVDLEVKSHIERRAHEGTGSDERQHISGVDAIKHRDLNVLSVVNIPLWDKARWSGMAYLFARRASDVPCVLFSFKDIDSGRKIFLGWLQKFGAEDPDDTIDITLITGVNRIHRHWYRVVVGHRLGDAAKSSGRLFGSSLRIHEMTPQNGTNLSQFIERYRRLGRYRIGPIDHRPMAGSIAPPEVIIEKRRLNIVSASSIGPDDILQAALQDEDDPVVADQP